MRAAQLAQRHSRVVETPTTSRASRPWPPRGQQRRRHWRKCGAAAAAADHDPAFAAQAWDMWERVRGARPLVQCITNYVSMDLMANTLLAAGCSPAMAHEPDEVEEFVALSGALLVNVGHANKEAMAASRLAAAKARELGVPWVLDPVGCGATSLRTRVCAELLALKPTLVRGNASEVLALSGAAGTTRGVDSTAGSDAALDAAKALASTTAGVVAVSGAVDYATDGARVLAVRNGVPALTLITATGCSVTALAAGFLAANPRDTWVEATAAALAVFGLAAEWAERDDPRKAGSGPGRLRVGLLDQLHLLSKDQVCKGVRIQEL